MDAFDYDFNGELENLAKEFRDLNFDDGKRHWLETLNTAADTTQDMLDMLQNFLNEIDEVWSDIHDAEGEEKIEEAMSGIERIW